MTIMCDEVTRGKQSMYTNANSRTRGCIYFLLAKRSSLVKIGFSTQPMKRIDDLQFASPEPLKLLALIKDVPYSVEYDFHRAFDGSRSHGEWFDYDLGMKCLLSTIHEYPADMSGEDIIEQLAELGWL